MYRSIILAVSMFFTATPQLLAQGIPGRNVTLVGPTPQAAACTTAPFCGGKLQDFGLKQQNEPSCAISPDTGAVFCGANDYRGTDRTDGILGDAWLGAMMSRNRDTWVSRLIPGFKGDTPSLGLAFGADPTVNAFPGGMGYVFIAGNRGDNSIGGIYFQRWVEMNKEDGYPFEPANEPAHQISSGVAGRFIDKPAAMINLVPGTCDIPFKRVDGTAGIRTVPKFEAAIAYAVFLGSDQSSNTAIWVVKSADCGLTWDTPGTKITQTVNVNQGVSLASIGDQFIATWRRFKDSNAADAIMSAVSTNRGKKWTQALVSAIVPFDQGTSNTTFRTNALPWLVSDGAAFHVFWAEREAATNLPRIKYSSTTTGTAWKSPGFVDNFAGLSGFQMIPSAAAAEGIVQVAWYDTRDDVVSSPGPLVNGLPFVNDYRDPAGNLHRHTIDVRAAQGVWNGTKLIFSSPSPAAPTQSIKVSSYQIGLAPPGFLGSNAQPVLAQLENNFANSRIFQQGKTPFVGDYIAVAANQWKIDPTTRSWLPNTAPTGVKPAFFVAWADNRLLRGNTVADLIQPTGYTPPTFTPLQDGVGDPTTTYPACSPSAPLASTRNQEIFGTAIKPGLIVSVPSAAKPTGTIQRAYVVWVRNTTSHRKSYKLHIANQPGDAPPAGTMGRATFTQLPLPPYSTGSPAPVVDACVTIPARSGAVKTVFVTSSSVQPPSISVQVSESDPATCAPIVGGETATALLNGNPLAADIENPDFTNSDFQNFSVKSVELHNPDIENKTFAAFTASADIENPDLATFTPEFADIENADIENADFQNFTVPYADIENADIENADIENADIENSAISEVTWAVKMNGNTTSGVEINPLFSIAPPHGTQLIVRRIYEVNTTQNCLPVKVAVNEIIANTVAPPNTLPAASVPVEPGETILITLRVTGTTSFNPAATGVVVTAQAKNTGHETDPSVPPASCNTSDPTQFCTSDVPKDLTPPTFTIVPDVTIGAAANSATAVVNYTVAAADNIAVTSVTCSPSSGSVFSIGQTRVSCIASDAAGNTATTSFNVTVNDVTPPAFALLLDITVDAAANATGANVTYSPSVSDAVGVTSLSCTPSSGTAFQVGSTTVTCVARDAAGNAATGTFHVIVKDATPPAIAKAPDMTIEATSAAGAAVIFALPQASDAVGVTSVSCAPASGSVFPIGATTVTCRASDAASNTATSTLVITVRDTSAPVIGATTNLTVNTSSLSGAVVSYMAPGATDAVGVTSVACAPPSGLLEPIGTTTVTCTAKDAALNQSTKTFTITVQLAFGFGGLSVPASANQGSVVPLLWQYLSSSGSPVDSQALVPLVRVRTLTSCTNGAETGPVFIDRQAPGNSDFNYSTTTFTWQFNWQTKLFAVGCYNIYVDLTNGQGSAIQTNGPVKVRLR
jgi:hypothetical protein